jgi:hypothetical protein
VQHALAPREDEVVDEGAAAGHRLRTDAARAEGQVVNNGKFVVNGLDEVVFDGRNRQGAGRRVAGQILCGLAFE